MQIKSYFHSQDKDLRLFKIENSVKIYVCFCNHGAPFHVHGGEIDYAFCVILAVKTTCFTQNLSNLNPKGEDSICKIDGFMATYTSNLKWAWQA